MIIFKRKRKLNSKIYDEKINFFRKVKEQTH